MVRWLAGVAMVGGLILPAGQTWAAVPEAQDKTVEVQCMPPGLPPFSTWQQLDSQPVIFSDEVGRPVLSVLSAYEARGQKLAAVWVGSILASVDAAPQDREAPSWYDAGAVTPRTIYKAERRQACEWFKPAPKPPHGEERT